MGEVDGVQARPHFRSARGLTARLTHKPHGLFHPIQIRQRRSPWRVFKPDSHMTPARNCWPNERRDVDAETGYHPRRVGGNAREQLEMHLEIPGTRWKAPSELIGEHEPVDGSRKIGHGLRKRRSEAGEARLIDRVTGMNMMRARDAQAFSNVRERVLVDK
jgi:hypothetical protein